MAPASKVCASVQWQHLGNTGIDRMGKTEHSHCQAALRAGCMMILQLSAAVPALLAKAGAPSPFYLECSEKQWEASQLKYQMPQ